MLYVSCLPEERIVIKALMTNAIHTCASVTTRGNAMAWKCSRGTKGNRLRIRVNGHKRRILSLCEVQVFGIRGE